MRDGQIFTSRELTIDAGQLKRSDEPPSRDLVRAHPAHIVPPELDLSTGRFEKAAYEVEYCRLARSVWTYKPFDGPSGHVKRHISNSGKLAERLAKSRYAQHLSPRNQVGDLALQMKRQSFKAAVAEQDDRDDAPSPKQRYEFCSAAENLLDRRKIEQT